MNCTCVQNEYKKFCGFPLLQAALSKGTEAASLLDAYHLKDRAEESIATEGPGEEVTSSIFCMFLLLYCEELSITQMETQNESKH